jgi:D-alanyl-D-alanine carboxypeptidase (penicillin-binding protein 5/6)
VTGLKTGSTSTAKYCFSATAEKDGIRLIATVMAAPDFKTRFADAKTLLDYGYANCKLYEDSEPPALDPLPVTDGVEPSVPLKYDGTFSYLSLSGEDFSAIEKKLELPETIEAPVIPDTKAGVLRYELNGKALGELDILTDGAVKKAGYLDYLHKLRQSWLLLRAR